MHIHVSCCCVNGLNILKSLAGIVIMPDAGVKVDLTDVKGIESDWIHPAGS